MPKTSNRLEKHAMQYVLAVDGGNTKTIALGAGSDGAILGVGFGGCADIYNAEPNATTSDPAQVALATVEQTIAAALRAAHLSPSDLAASVFNMAGADWPEDIAFWRDAMTARNMGHRIIAQNDAL